MTEALKPCPFCGGSAVVAEAYTDYIRCTQCAAFGPTGEDMHIAAYKWNTRHSDENVIGVRWAIAGPTGRINMRSFEDSEADSWWTAFTVPQFDGEGELEKLKANGYKAVQVKIVMVEE